MEMEITSSIDNGKDAQILEIIYNQLKRDLANPNSSSHNLNSLVEQLNIGLQKNTELRKIFWKDQMVYHLLTGHLSLYLHQTSCLTSNNDEDLSPRYEELQTAILLLNTLLVTLCGTDNILEKIQMFQFNQYKMMRALLQILVQPPNMGQYLHLTCSRMLEHFNEYNSYAWTNLPEARLIKCSAEITNISTAMLYELFVTMDNIINNRNSSPIARLMEGVRLDYHLKRSMTQLLGLLFGCKGRKLEPGKAVLVYKHFFVLRYLLENIKRVRDYVHDHFKEEFRYYISWHRVNQTVPDNYPVKVLLQSLVESVHRLGTVKQ